MVNNKDVYEIVLEKDQMAFLEAMVRQYGLPDVSKAVRCLINFVIDEDAEQGRVFEEIRCLDCG